MTRPLAGVLLGVLFAQPRFWRTALCTLVSTGAYMAIQGLMLWPSGVPFWLLAVAFSYFGTAGAMNHAILAQGMPPALTGRVSTSFSLLMFSAAFGLQWVLGAVINLWPSDSGQYPEAAVQTALAVCLAVQVPGLLWWLGFKPWQLASAPAAT